MGVADNKTYRNQYHFTDDFRDTAKENPSINVDPKINQTIKENPYRSNVEIEGGELVLQPDLSALFKAQGKRHSKGGMDVLLRPDSFIFSDFKDLAVTEKEKELFELKEGGSTSPQNNTPAEIVKKNVPVKHYNSLIANISDPFKDDLARKSSAMMLEKYINTLGNIAYIQESKKDFPTGLPSFSLGTAPVYEQGLKDQIDESKQYMKEGGIVYSEGGSVSKCPCGKDSNGNCLPCTDAQLQDLMRRSARGRTADVAGMNKVGSLGSTDIYHVGTDPTRGAKIKPGMTDAQWREYLKNESPERKARRLASYQTPGSDKLIRVDRGVPTTIPSTPRDFSIGPRPTPSNKLPEVLPSPGIPTGEQQYGKRADWQFTPWQKISQMWNWGQFANVRRYMPMRSHYNATFAEPALLNPEQTVGDVKGAFSSQLSANNSLSPILRGAQNNQAYGQMLSQIPNIRTQYDNQNAQISNQFRQYNNQVRNNESLINMQNDQTYYQQSIEGRKNFDNMRSYTANNAMNNVMRDVETNQKLAYDLLTQNNPAYSFDWRTGDFLRNPKDIRDVQNSSQGDYIGNLLQDIDFKSLSDGDKIKFIRELQRGKALQYLPQAFGQTPPPFPTSQKKGGKVKKNPYY